MRPTPSTAVVPLALSLLLPAIAHAQQDVLEALGEAAQSAPTKPPHAAESPRARRARGVVARARALFDVGDYGAALAEFTRALQLLEGDPRQLEVLHNIALCHERLFRYDLALEYYQRFLDADPDNPEDRAEVEQLMEALRRLLARVTITSNAPGEVWVSRRKLGEPPSDLLIPAGTHLIEVRARGYEAARREVQLPAGSAVRLHFELTPLPPDRGLPPAYFWTGAGLTAAALVTGSVLGMKAIAAHDRGQRWADRRLAFPAAEAEQARDLTFAADVAFGSAVVFGVGTTILFFLTSWGEREPAPEARALSNMRLGIAPGADGRSWSASLQGVLP